VGSSPTGPTFIYHGFGLPLELVASRNYPTMSEALAIERKLKSWKSPTKARDFLFG